MTPTERATKSAKSLWAGDAASQALGMKVVEIDRGTATLQMTVKSRHLNGHGKCHGGIMFMLADSAFALACNSRNQKTVAQVNTITYIAAVSLGDVLTATASELSRSGRSGIYDVRVVNKHGKTVAEFRGHSRTIQGQLFSESDEREAK